MSYRFIVSTAMMLIALLSRAQVKEVIFIEGGSFGSPGNKVFFNSYNPKTKQIKSFDSIPGDFTHGALVNGHYGFLYVGSTVDSLNYLCKYDLRTKKIVTKTAIPGLQQMTVYQDKILVTKGYPLTSNFFAVYNQSNLSKITEFAKVSLSAQGIAIVNDKAYIAMEGSWPSYTDSGTVAVINLKTMAYEKTFKVDSLNKIFRTVTSYKNNLYFFGDSLITQFDPKMNTYNHFGFGKPIKFMDQKGRNLILKLKDNQVIQVNLDSISNMPSVWFTQPSILGLFDPVEKQYFSINTDYFSFGHLIHHNRILNSFDTSKIKIAAESMAFYEKAMENFDDYTKVLANSKTFTVDILSNDTLIANHPYGISLDKSSSISGNSASIVGNKLQYNANGVKGIDTLIYSLCDSITYQCTVAKVLIELYDNTSQINEVINASTFFFKNNALHYQTNMGQEKIQLFNVLGEQILHETIEGNGTIETNDLSDGIYFVRFKNQTVAINK